MLPPCERLKAVEAALAMPHPCLCDVHGEIQWMVGQIRFWQDFAKKVVDFGEIVHSAPIRDPQIENAYENLFHGS